jgi:putative ABC transport system ATP-binding protein
MITVKNLFKTYKTGAVEFPVLKHISLTIKKGEFVAITGRSGSGKSTLLYQLSLLDTPTSGEIYLNDIYTNELTDEQRIHLA